MFIYLKYIKYHSDGEIMKIMGYGSIRSVQNRIYQARKNLEKIVEDKLKNNEL